MSRIVVLGDLNLDVHAKQPTHLDSGSELRSTVWAAPGGSAGTFARVASDEGAWVTFIGCVGNDLIGDLLVRSLEASGVRPHICHVDLPSGTILALEQGTERAMVCSRGANDGLTADSVDEVSFDGIDHLHVSGYALLSDPQRDAARRAMGLAHARGASISVDPPPANLIEHFGVASFLEELKQVTWIFPNLTEGQTLTELEDPEEIVDSLANRFLTGALTLGSAGALAWRGRERNLQPPPRMVSGDSTGAGDAFAAAFSVSLLGGSSLSDANARGCEVAAGRIHG